jgi:hypothetical protein
MTNPILSQLTVSFTLGVLATIAATNWPVGRGVGTGRAILRAITTLALFLPTGFFFWMLALKLAYGPDPLFGTTYAPERPFGMLAAAGFLWVPVLVIQWVRQLRQRGDR